MNNFPQKWTPIAIQQQSFVGLTWAPMEGAPILVADARKARDRGVLLMAQRRGKDGRFELLVKAKAV